MGYNGRTWMLFIDGENFTIRGQDKAAKLDLPPDSLSPIR
jgi:hypothetical protein